MRELSREEQLESIISDFAGHVDLRCYHYGVCFCGLNDALEEVNLPRIPCTVKGK